MNHVEATGKTIEDAVRSGLVQLGLTRDEVTVEVLSEPKSGFLGIGSKPAVVRKRRSRTRAAAAAGRCAQGRRSGKASC